MFGTNVTFQCLLDNDELVYVSCTELNEIIRAEPNDLIFYTDSDNNQGQCKKRELTFISVKVINVG